MITGAGAGLGRAIAGRFAREGARGLALLDIDAAGVAETAAGIAEELGGGAPRLLTRTVDVTDGDSVLAAFTAAAEEFDGLDVVLEQTDMAPGALPGLHHPAAAALVDAAGGRVRAKYGWTDVARFAALGIPAVNYGPGDPNLAHRRDERVAIAQITAVTETLRRYLGGTG